ncbi:hypothetical protein BUY18_11150 [Staphylococcus cohnii]|uniref:ABC-2 transporter permease n=1 Tax=Staphylococcus ureilyticus TaxID=94138 RepID=UPI000D1CA278|nr:ABC-2 transporter permease [Staphylococcus ureilyticus]MBM9448529.1 ABC-2 transporter permease [Staphylococcus ureilyticus]PTF44895.1 hypothetical protein BUY18_11150 [Staphylococcus cohnii]
MKGLLLNQYYSVNKSILLYFIVGIIISTFLLVLAIPYTKMIATLLTIVLIVTPALEVLKREANSGWNTYIMVLPFTRKNIVASHYIFYLILALLGFLTSICVLLISIILGSYKLDAPTIAMVLNCLSVILFLGTVVYPLTYFLGSSRADGIIIISSLVIVAVYNLVALIYIYLFQPIFTKIFSNLDQDILFAVLYLIMNVFLYYLSFLISKKIHFSKEL